MRYRALITALALTPTALPACELALVLAVDVSGSVERSEYDLQMQGLAAALQDGAVSEALVNAQARVMLLQWTGAGRQIVSIPWTPITDFDQADGFALQVAETPRRWRNFSTAVGEAMRVALTAFEDPAVIGCTRHVIDISGDGSSNEGLDPLEARALALSRRVTINALAIENEEAGLVDYFRTHVITGPGAFALRAADYHTYQDRIRQKLIREITKQIAVLVPPH